jgi:xanthine/CO dehydrogenase XdhC/CoxF family maturation factor
MFHDLATYRGQGYRTIEYLIKCHTNAYWTNAVTMASEGTHYCGLLASYRAGHNRLSWMERSQKHRT